MNENFKAFMELDESQYIIRTWKVIAKESITKRNKKDAIKDAINDHTNSTEIGFRLGFDHHCC